MNLPQVPRSVLLFALGFVLGLPAGCAAGGGQIKPTPETIDFGAAIAVQLCKLEAPKRGFDPALCQVGSDFLRPFIDDAAKQFAANATRDPFVGTASVRSTPCPPFADGPAPPPPGTAAGGAGQ